MIRNLKHFCGDSDALKVYHNYSWTADNETSNAWLNYATCNRLLVVEDQQLEIFEFFLIPFGRLSNLTECQMMHV